MKGPSGRIFLLSPADCSGKRATLLASSDTDFALAQQMRTPAGAELGEVFSFVSSLYFRGKLAYARAFGLPPEKLNRAYVITPGDGLRPPESRVTRKDLRRYARVPVDPADSRYRIPLLRDLEALAAEAREAEIVLLGSIASGKYVELLTSVLGRRLLFPGDFVGRGDMSRGGLMLRCAGEGRELSDVTLLDAERRGPRPARLPPLRSHSSGKSTGPGS
jgi:hypothetical protein